MRPTSGELHPHNKIPLEAVCKASRQVSFLFHSRYRMWRSISLSPSKCNPECSITLNGVITMF